jgi:hypothetical protein
MYFEAVNVGSALRYRCDCWDEATNLGLGRKA